MVDAGGAMSNLEPSVHCVAPAAGTQALRDPRQMIPPAAPTSEGHAGASTPARPAGCEVLSPTRRSCHGTNGRRPRILLSHPSGEFGEKGSGDTWGGERRCRP